MQAQTVRILYAVLSGIVQFLQQPCIREFQHLPIALIEPKQKIPINVEPFYWRFRLLYGGCNKSQIFINRDLKCIISKSSTVHISGSFYLKALLSLQEKKNSRLFGWGSFLKFSETEKKTKRPHKKLIASSGLCQQRKAVKPAPPIVAKIRSRPRSAGNTIL